MISQKTLDRLKMAETVLASRDYLYDEMCTARGQYEILRSSERAHEASDEARAGIAGAIQALKVLEGQLERLDRNITTQTDTRSVEDLREKLLRLTTMKSLCEALTAEVERVSVLHEQRAKAGLEIDADDAIELKDNGILLDMMTTELTQEVSHFVLHNPSTLTTTRSLG